VSAFGVDGPILAPQERLKQAMAVQLNSACSNASPNGY
jgi:hypothetical protein